MDSKKGDEKRSTYARKRDVRALEIVISFFIFLMVFQVFNFVMEGNINLMGVSISNLSRNTDSTLTMVGDGKFYILSAIAEQSATDSRWTWIVFNGWEQRDNISTKYLCCFHFADGIVMSRMPSNRTGGVKDNNPMPKQIVCDISSMSQPGHAGLVLANESCTADAVFHQVVYRKRQEKPKLAIGAQIAYGSKNPIELIEWMEFHLHFGVDAVVIYPYYDLNPEAMKVLKYYAKRELLEIVHFPPVPLSSSDTVRLLDVQVANFDAQQRLQEYKYFIIMDTDEYIVPGNNTNITNYVRLMEYLTQKYQLAAKFMMLTELHLLEWEKTNNKTDILIAQHGYHSEPRKVAPKSLLVTARVWPGTIRTHSCMIKKDYRMYILDPRDVVLKHYRYCKANWFKPLDSELPACLATLEKIKGHFMDKVAKLIARSVAKVKRYLKLN